MREREFEFATVDRARSAEEHVKAFFSPAKEIESFVSNVGVDDQKKKKRRFLLEVTQR